MKASEPGKSDAGSPAGDSAVEQQRADDVEQQREEEQIESRRPPSANIVYETIRREGEEEMERPALSLSFSALAAGLSMTFSLVASGVLQDRLPAAHWAPLVVSLGYPVGFVIVVLGRQQLFTENTLTPVLPFLSKPSPLLLFKVARIWAIVLTANVVGAALGALIIAKTAAFDPHMQSAFGEVVRASCCTDFGATFIKAVFAGWIIALMVWLLPAAEQTRLWIIILLTYLVAASSLSHIVAGSVEVLYGVYRGIFDWPAFWGAFFVPTLLGNIVGGLVLVAFLNYGQIVAERNEKPAGNEK